MRFVGWQVDGLDYSVFLCIDRQFEIGAYTTMTFPVCSLLSQKQTLMEDITLFEVQTRLETHPDDT